MKNIVFLIKKADSDKKEYIRNDLIKLLKDKDIEIKHKNYTRINLEDCFITIKELNLNRANDLKKHNDNLIFCLFNNRGNIITKLKERCSVDLNITSLDMSDKRYLETLLPYLDISKYIIQTRYQVDIHNENIIQKEITINTKDINNDVVKNARNNFYLTEAKAYEAYNNYLKEQIDTLEKSEKEYIRKARECKLKIKKYENIINNNGKNI